VLRRRAWDAALSVRKNKAAAVRWQRRRNPGSGSGTGAGASSDTEPAALFTWMVSSSRTSQSQGVRVWRLDGPDLQNNIIWKTEATVDAPLHTVVRLLTDASLRREWDTDWQRAVLVQSIQADVPRLEQAAEHAARRRRRRSGSGSGVGAPALTADTASQSGSSVDGGRNRPRGGSGASVPKRSPREYTGPSQAGATDEPLIHETIGRFLGRAGSSSG